MHVICVRSRSQSRYNMKKILITADSAQDLFTVINEMMCNDETFTYHPEQAGIVMDAPDNVEAFRGYVLSLGETCKVEEFEEVEKHIFIVSHTSANKTYALQAFKTLEEASFYVDTETEWTRADDTNFEVYTPTKRQRNNSNTTIVFRLRDATIYESYEIKELVINE